MNKIDQAEIERAQAELAHWLRVHAEHPEWSNPRLQVKDARLYLKYLQQWSDT